ncbi:hypothetical protein EKI60_01150 [Candidatus Saccharibacteria bacterium]|nr:MAG: hypothetical protein EKI60_01150 [Candidatus Saccharibacteria bacterium]TXG76082.1 MAG: hypothetical protein E6P97_04215 [Patescibacteria group bacterium]
MRKKLKLIGNLATPSLKTYITAATVVLLASLLVSFWTWNNARTSLKRDIATTLQGGTDGARDMVISKIGTYAEVLNGAAGLFKALPTVNQQAWTNYVSHLNIQNRYPGLQAIVYSEVVPDNERDAYIAGRQTDRPGFSIRPEGQRDVYVPVRLIEPNVGENAQVIGFDPYQEPARKKAMDQARDTGALSITSRLVLVPDQNNPKASPGFIIFVPVYSNNAPLDTVNERRAALIGFVSAGVRSYELIDGLLGSAITENSAVQVFDGTNQDAKNLIYESPTLSNLRKQPGIISSSSVITVGSNRWTLVGYVNQSIASKAQRNQPRLFLIAGILFSFMIAGGLLFVMITRARHIAHEKNREVQEAKDSLISLASHQLRTPATGVKQFIGMLMDGYAGDVSKEQKRMLQKAYQSNERQLEIINQILHVTRADSGRLVLRKEPVDLHSLIRRVIDEHAGSIKDRQQRVIVSKARAGLSVQADPQYLTMVLDNLLSNASKYSHPRTTIRITTKQSGDTITIAVSDAGVGISDEDMPRLFQKFSRIDNELSIEAGGTGIGLYLCEQVMTLHDGSITVKSTEGEGSTFTVSLPSK